MSSHLHPTSGAFTQELRFTMEGISIDAVPCARAAGTLWTIVSGRTDYNPP
jgi:hypothetical protein